jgi:tetratricopeptide (TPR) repeat protein
MTRTTCLSARRIADVVQGTAADADVVHLSTCTRCVSRVTLARRVANIGIAEVCRTLDEIDHLLRSLGRWKRTQWESAASEPEFHRPEFARRLLSLAAAARFQDRLLCIDYVRVATAVSDRLAPPDADLSFEAWKFRHAVTREAGRYRDAEVALSRAESLAPLTSHREVASASVCVARALFYAEPDIWRRDEALELLDRADEIFVSHDKARLRTTEAIRGFVFYRSAEYHRALDCFEKVLVDTPTSDVMAVLDAASNVATARVALRNTDANLREELVRLIRAYENANSPERVARLRWGLARLEQNLGNYDDAFALLTSVRRTIGDPDAALRVTLDVIENHLLRGDARTALKVAQNLVSESLARERAEPSRRHTITVEAYSYVRQAAQLEMLTPDLVVQVAAFVDQITSQRPIDFKPPMLLAAM